MRVRCAGEQAAEAGEEDQGGAERKQLRAHKRRGAARWPRLPVPDHPVCLCTIGFRVLGKFIFGFLMMVDIVQVWLLLLEFESVKTEVCGMLAVCAQACCEPTSIMKHASQKR